MSFLNSVLNLSRKNSIKILMYHRIANTINDPFNLAVSPNNFEKHLQALKKYNVISLDDMFEIITKRQKIKRNTIVITFDDAYVDNFTIAKPLLENYKIPATFFVSTNAIITGSEFWWDALERIIFSRDTDLLKLKNYLYFLNLNIKEINPTNNLEFYYECCKAMQSLNYKDQTDLLFNITQFTKNKTSRNEYLTMNLKQLKEVKTSPFITIGAHSVTHAFLPNFDYNYQLNEINESILFLEKELTTSINYFAYPMGGSDINTIKVMKRLKIKLAFTTEHREFTDHQNIYHIPRLQVFNKPTLDL